MRSNKPNFFSRFRTSDRIILGVISVLALVTVVLNVMQRFGLALINQSVALYLPIAALVALLGWGAYALMRRIKGRMTRVVVGIFAVMAMMILVMLGFMYLSFVAYTALPHQYRTMADASGGHPLVVLWQFDDDAERNEASIAERKAARLEAYPDSGEDTLADDVTVAFQAYPRVMGIFYRVNADMQGRVYLAYTGNIAPTDVIAPAEGSDDAPQAIETPHGTMMLEWLEDNTVAHFYVKDPGTAEGGECTVRFE